MWWFIGYVWIFGVSGLLVPEKFFYIFVSRQLTLVQLLILFWIASNLLQDEKFTRHTLFTFSVAALLAATGMLLRLPGFSKSVTVEQRLTTAGFNPNELGMILALAAVALIGLGLDKTLRSIRIRVIFAAMCLPLLTAMVYTGSRTAMAVFLIGAALYPLPYRKSKRKMTAIIWIAICVVGVMVMVVRDPSALSRWKRTYDSGDTAGRDRIFAASAEMISEQPFFGWQPIVFQFELGPRVGRLNRDAHNLFLHLLMEVGLVGTLPFLVGLWCCARAAWEARTGNLGLLPLVLMITLMGNNMAGTGLARKLFWLILALSLASRAFIAQQHHRKIVVANVLKRLNASSENASIIRRSIT
jgi:O-antigen ligase